MEVWCLFLAQGVRKKKHITTHKCVFWMFSCQQNNPKSMVSHGVISLTCIVSTHHSVVMLVVPCTVSWEKNLKNRHTWSILSKSTHT